MEPFVNFQIYKILFMQLWCFIQWFDSIECIFKLFYLHKNLNTHKLKLCRQYIPQLYSSFPVNCNKFYISTYVIMCYILNDVDGNVQPLWKTDCFLKKLKRELPYSPLIPLLGMYPKEIKSLSRRDICTPMFTAAKVQKCLWMDKWIKKMWYT